MAYNLKQFYLHTIKIFDDYSIYLVCFELILVLSYFDLPLIHLNRYRILILSIYLHHNEIINLPSNHYHTPHIFMNNSSF